MIRNQKKGRCCVEETVISQIRANPCYLVLKLFNIVLIFRRAIKNEKINSNDGC